MVFTNVKRFCHIMDDNSVALKSSFLFLSYRQHLLSTLRFTRASVLSCTVVEALLKFFLKYLTSLLASVTIMQLMYLIVLILLYYSAPVESTRVAFLRMKKKLQSVTVKITWTTLLTGDKLA